MEFNHRHLPLLLLFLISSATAYSLTPTCNSDDHDSTLKVFHVSSPCSPFRSKSPLSWPETVLKMQADDQTRIAYLSSLVAGKSFVPIGSGRQVGQNPSYIVKAKIGTPGQTLVMALDTSTDMAMVPCTGCVGCGSSNNFDFGKSTTFSAPKPCSKCRPTTRPALTTSRAWSPESRSFRLGPEDRSDKTRVILLRHCPGKNHYCS